MKHETESRFLAGMKSTAGVIFAIFLICVVAPCMVCGGMATCGVALDEVQKDAAAEREDK